MISENHLKKFHRSSVTLGHQKNPSGRVFHDFRPEEFLSDTDSACLPYDSTDLQKYRTARLRHSA